MSSHLVTNDDKIMAQNLIHLSSKGKTLISFVKELKEACTLSLSKDPTEIITDRIKNLFFTETHSVLKTVSSLPNRERNIVSNSVSAFIQEFEDVVAKIESKFSFKNKGDFVLEDPDCVASVIIGEAENIRFSISKLSENNNSGEYCLEICIDGFHRQTTFNITVSPKDLRNLGKTFLSAAKNIEEQLQ